MPLFTTDQLARFWDQGENEASDAVPMYVDRVSLDIVSGTSTYTIPDYVRSIRRITYLGQKLDPLPRRNQRDVFQSATQRSKPFWYVYNNLEINTISLFPIPDQTIAAAVGNLWAPAAISAACVVEFYRITTNVAWPFVLPVWIRRQLLKQYVQMKCFSLDGSGYNSKMVQYFAARWQMRLREYEALLEDVHSKPRKLVTNEIVSSNYFPAQPILPLANFGIAVDEGQ